MNKKELVDHIAETVDCTKADAGRMLDATTDAIFDTLKKGDEVAVAGFGTFATSKRAARVARNPRTGEAINVPAMRVPKFKAAKALKEAVR
jgi:DNA-binding protein HU-beta